MSAISLLDSAARALANGFPKAARALVEDATQQAHAECRAADVSAMEARTPEAYRDALSARAAAADTRARCEYVFTFVARVSRLTEGT